MTFYSISELDFFYVVTLLNSFLIICRLIWIKTQTNIKHNFLYLRIIQRNCWVKKWKHFLIETVFTPNINWEHVEYSIQLTVILVFTIIINYRFCIVQIRMNNVIFALFSFNRPFSSCDAWNKLINKCLWFIHK